MSDIPIGSPPVPPGRHAAPSGWYPDPVDPAQERYWDGWQWSRNTRPSGRGPMPSPGPQSYPPYGQPGQQFQQPNQQQPYSQQSYPQQPYQQQPYGLPQYPAAQRVAGSRPQVWTADGVPVTGWWWRVLAMIIDSLIVGTVAALLSSPIYVAMFARFAELFNEIVRAAEAGLPPPPQPDPLTLIPITDQLILTTVALLVEAVYIVIFLRWKSATPGKLVCGLRVVPVDQGRFPGPLPWNTILIRMVVWVLPAISVYLLVFRLVDVLYPLWQPKRQALHDLAAKTQVVKIR